MRAVPRHRFPPGLAATPCALLAAASGTHAAGSFRTDLLRTRVNYTFSPRMFFSGLFQYNSTHRTLGANLRLRWEYPPGSELFVVYTAEQEVDPLRPVRRHELADRAFVIKINRLFRF